MQTVVHEKMNWNTELEYYNEELDIFYDLTSIHYCDNLKEYNVYVKGNHTDTYHTYKDALEYLIQDICIEYDEDWKIFEF